jgi:hypothetical protein
MSRKRTLLVKLEATPGTAETTGFSALLAFDIKMEPTAEWAARPGSGLYAGHTVGGVLGAITGRCAFSAELRTGTGTVLDPALAACLQACGALKSTESYATDTAFARAAGARTLTIRANIDGVLMQLAGAAGTFTLKGAVGERVMLDFELTGRWIAVTDVALPADAAVTTAPMKLESGTFTIGAEAIKIANYTLTWGAKTSLRADVAAAGGVGHYLAVDYDPEITLDPEFDRVAGYDFYGLWLAGTTAAVVITAKAGARTATITCPAVQIKQLAEGDRDGIATVEYTGACLNDGATAPVTIAIT